MSFANIVAATRRLVSDDKGVTAVEYGVLGALIIVVYVLPEEGRAQAKFDAITLSQLQR